MHYEEVIGQDAAKSFLRQQVAEGRIPHAQLIAGPEGSGTLPLALAYATALLCEHPTDGEPCHACQGCRLADQLVHPDLHFVFPTESQRDEEKSLSERQIEPWREQLQAEPYFNLSTFQRRCGAEGKKYEIRVAEAKSIIATLSVMSKLGVRKVMVVWLPEMMNETTANKLLKIVEEPPAQTVFLLVSEAPDRLLPTILSRTQQISLSPLPEAVVAEALQKRQGVGEADAKVIAHQCEGNFVRALSLLQVDAEQSQFLDMFMFLMRMAYARRIKELYEWAENITKWSREQQANFLAYALRLVRENFMYNFRDGRLVYLSAAESQFSSRFARFINERNIIGISEELSKAQDDIVRNVNARMVFFDLALKMIMLLIR